MKKTLKEILRNEASEELIICYLGNEGMLFAYQGFCFVCAPYLSYYTDENCCTDQVKWVRNYAPPLEGRELDFVDVVTLSHAHYDHADPYTIASILSTNTKVKFIFPKGEERIMAQYHLTPTNTLLAQDQLPIEIGPLKIIPIKAAHEEFHVDEFGHYKELGYLFEIGPYRIFHAGDMCPYDGLVESLGILDVACLPINGRSIYKRDVLDIIGNFEGKEALELAKKTSTKLMLPLHFDLYDINTTDIEVFKNEVQENYHNLNVHIPTLLEIIKFKK